MSDLHIYIQFKSEDEVSEFAKLIKGDEEAMLHQYRDAEAQDLICVFKIRDRPDIRKIVLDWRNR